MQGKTERALVIFCAACVAGCLFSIIIVRGAGVTASGTVTNATSVISAVAINNNQAMITLTPNTTTNVNVNATISDNDGCADITGGTTTILLYRSGIGSSTCLSVGGVNPLNCYVSTSFTASSTCSGISVNTTTTFPVQYYAQATDASSSFLSQNWMATVIFTDPSSTTASVDSTSVSTTNDVASLVALNIPVSSLSYGTLFANNNTTSTNQLLNIENAGNASHTIQVQGTAFTLGSNTIPTSSQHYATSSFTFGGGETALSDSATTITGINTAPVIKFPIGGAGWTYTTVAPHAYSVNTSVAYNGYLYTIGGDTVNDVYFAPINATGSLGAWSVTQLLPYPDYSFASVAYNGYIYAIAGHTDNGATSTVLFAPINATGSLGAWNFTTALPSANTLHSSVVYNGYLYTIGGCVTSNCSVITSTVLFAPINATGSLGAWNFTTALPYSDEGHTSVAYNGYIYTIGGCVNACSAFTSTVLFAPINATGSLGAWTSTQALPYTISAHTSIVYNGYLYTIGGSANNSDTSTVLFAPINATGSVSAWSSTQALPYTVTSYGGAVYNGYLYTVGGRAGGINPTSTVLFAPLNARSTYWGAGVPSVTAAGTYTAVTTFIGVFSP